MSILVSQKQPYQSTFSPNNSVRMTVLLLVITFGAAVAVSSIFNIQINAPSYVLLGLMLFPMSHLFNTYNSILQVRTLDGLNNNEIRRLNHTIAHRANNILKVMLIYLVVICSLAVVGVTGVVSSFQALLLSVGVIVSSFIDTTLAWKTIQEIRDFEQTLILRMNSEKAKNDIIKQAN